MRQWLPWFIVVTLLAFGLGMGVARHDLLAGKSQTHYTIRTVGESPGRSW